MAMSPEVRAEYDKALIAAILKRGTMVSEDASIYGWEDYDYHFGPSWSRAERRTPHHLACVLVSIGRPVETRWDEFQGTFYEGDTSEHGVELPGITCECGKLEDRTLRWKASPQAIAEAVFEEAFGKKEPEKSKCPGPPHKGHASSDWTCPLDADRSEN